MTTLKVELHAHTADDPVDHIAHTASELIDRSAALGYQAIAITLHDAQLDPEPLRDHAAARGLVLIPGVERDIEGKHVLLLNFSPRTEHVRTFDELATLRTAEPGGLVIAPHPFFPGRTCLGDALDRHPELFDAVEVNAMFTTRIDFNRRAVRWARRHARPLVGNADVHRLAQLGSTYTLVSAAPTPDAICQAIRQGRVEVVARPLSLVRAMWLFAQILPAGTLGAWKRRG